jgi:hypothetical protein
MSAGRRRLAQFGRPTAFTPSVSSKLVNNPLALSRAAGENICALRSGIHNPASTRGSSDPPRSRGAAENLRWEAIHE